VLVASETTLNAPTRRAVTGEYGESAISTATTIATAIRVMRR
jgi:hypothetical protein